MSEFRFIHCSDLHLDSPFSGLTTVKPELKKGLQEATFRSFENIISLAISEKVNAVLIAGDIYDSTDKSLRAQLAFRDGLARLSEQGIPSFVAHGNHDPMDTWSASLNWPEKVTVFPSDRVESFDVNSNGNTLATIYGISYPQKEVYENFALRFKRNIKDRISVGVLHANAGADPNHANYAPCRLDDLVSAKMDYWALGHVHSRKILRKSSPAIVYCGNSQARNFRETGPKGCYVVALQPNQVPEIRFEETDVFRFYNVDIDISESSSFDGIIRVIVNECEKLVSVTERCKLFIRARIIGRTHLHKELKRERVLADLSEDIQNRLDGFYLGVWIDFKFETRGVYNIDSLCRSNEFLADMIHLYGKANESKGLEEIRLILKPVFEKWEGERFLDEISDEELKGLLSLARGLSLDHLAESD